MADILLNIFSKIGGYSVDPTIRQVRYLFDFKNIVEDLKKESESLGSKQARVQRDVSIAKQKDEAIEQDVRKWLSEVEGDMKEVQNLEEKIQGNKRCLCGWCPNMVWRYNLGKDATKKIATIRKLQEDGNFDRVSYPKGLEFIPSQETHFKSTESAFNQIMEALKSDEYNMIGLYGTGGVGKTTMAEEVLKRAKELKLFDCLVMAVVSQNRDLTNIQDQIADFLGLRFEEKTKEGRASRLFSRLMNKKILIILDDVWENLNLAKDIGIPYGDDHKGCKILLTTRRVHVCNLMGSKKNIQLNTLSQEDAWALFKKSAALNDNSPTLNDAAMEVARECKGLPLAIVVVGSALNGKTLDEYKLASENLKRSKPVGIEDTDEKVYASLQLSYNYLKTRETKLCFLLCSLFPEDYEINIEDLVWYGMGLDLFEDGNSIEKSRRRLRVIINDLKASSLLLESSEKKFVKMHDVVRDVALWIASKGENVFMVRAGVGLTEWLEEESCEQYTAISLMANRIKELPSKLECPRLKILLLGGDSVTIADAFFEDTKALKVLSIYQGILSLQSVQFLTNLRTLKLRYCEFDDISSLGKLKKLEILCFDDSAVEELPNEIGELNNLRLLALNGCRKLKRIPPNVISKLSKLEELYIGGNNHLNWEVKGPDVERSNASLRELNSLSDLVVLSLRLDAKYLPIGFAFPKLERYEINMRDPFYVSEYVTSRILRIKDMNATSLNAFKKLFPTVEYLDLVSAMGFQNIIPNMDQEGLNDLISLSLESCDEMECLINSTQQLVPTTAFSNLEKLSLNEMTHLREIWKGPTQYVNLQRLIDVEVSNCSRLTYVFSSSLARSLVQLQRLKIDKCEGLEQIISIEEEDGEISSEAHPQPPYFSKLATLEITNCQKLEYIFLISIGRGLRQLEKLQILNCIQLKQVFSPGKEDDGFVGDGNDIELPKLRKIVLERLSNLTSFSEGNYHWMCASLQELTVVKCPKLMTSFIIDLETNLPALEKQLRVLRIGNHSQLHKTVILLQNLEELTIENCEGVEEVFHGNSSFSKLKEMELEDLPELRVIWKGPTQISSFQNLTKIKVINCNKLTQIFSPSLARNLLRLELLWIEGCKELERIIGEEDKDEENQIIRFPNLNFIYVEDCSKLKSLFPITITRGLPRLDKLWVEKASQLEEVFCHENEENVRDEKKILLPNLDCLHLLELPRLISFCRGGYHFIFPSFLRLRVKDCPNIITSFTIASDNRTVHAIDKAKTETPQLVKEDLLEGSSTTQAIVATMPRNSDIYWDYGDRNTLPPYMEESSGNLFHSCCLKILA